MFQASVKPLPWESHYNCCVVCFLCVWNEFMLKNKIDLSQDFSLHACGLIFGLKIKKIELNHIFCGIIWWISNFWLGKHFFGFTLKITNHWIKITLCVESVCSVTLQLPDVVSLSSFSNRLMFSALVNPYLYPSVVMLVHGWINCVLFSSRIFYILPKTASF